MNFEAHFVETQKNYERARLWTALKHSLGVSALFLLLALLRSFPISHLPLLSLPFLLFFFAEWRGGAFGKGVRRGLLLGAVLLCLPMACLRPCCKTMGAMVAGAEHSMACCGSVSYCSLSGIAAGLLGALLLPRVPKMQIPKVMLGMFLSVISVGLLRCVSLLWGEAFGLLGGMLMGAYAVQGLKLAALSFRKLS